MQQETTKDPHAAQVQAMWEKRERIVAGVVRVHGAASIPAEKAALELLRAWREAQREQEEAQYEVHG